jgi:hypothetical protein
MRVEALTQVAKLRWYGLPVRLKGCGLRPLVDRRHAELPSFWVGWLCMVDGVLLLFGATTADKTLAQVGLLAPSSKVLTQLFGRSSFIENQRRRWAVLLHSPCSLSKGLLAAFHGYRDLFRATGHPDSVCKFLLTEATQFGTTVEGMPAFDMRPSFTKDLTAQLEQARYKGLNVAARSCAFHLGIRPGSKPN